MDWLGSSLSLPKFRFCLCHNHSRLSLSLSESGCVVSTMSLASFLSVPIFALGLVLSSEVIRDQRERGRFLNLEFCFQCFRC